MLQRLKDVLSSTPNGAADDCLLEALARGTPAEQEPVLQMLLARKNSHGLSGIVRQFDRLPERLKATVVERLQLLYPVLPECGRSQDHPTRIQAMRLIALGRQGKLAYVLTENLATHSESLAEAAASALAQLAVWVTREVRRVQSGKTDRLSMEGVQSLIDQRHEIEAAVYRALDQHSGNQIETLLRAALVLSDSANSKTLSILSTSRHGGVSPMVRKMQQVPEAECVDAFLLGATHGQLRSQFAATFGAIETPVTLDALLRRTYWLKDARLPAAMAGVTRGAWWSLPHLQRELARLKPEDVADVAAWISTSMVHEQLLDECLIACQAAAADDAVAGVRMVNLAARLSGGVGIGLLKGLITSPHEAVARLAVRQLARRMGPEAGGLLLPLMQNSPPTVRRVISRTVGIPAFESYWQRFDKLEIETRRQAGRAVLKLLPEVVLLLQRRLSGPMDQVLRGLQMAHELQLADAIGPQVVPLLKHVQPRVRSKAVSVLGQLTELLPAPLLEAALADTDPRVRANAIEVLERRGKVDYLSVLAERARSGHNRERANALKALHGLKAASASAQLAVMLHDERPEHRISGLWAVRQLKLNELLPEISRLAQQDENIKVRRYALAVLKGMTLQEAAAMAAKKQQPLPTITSAVPSPPVNVVSPDARKAG